MTIHDPPMLPSSPVSTRVVGSPRARFFKGFEGVASTTTYFQKVLGNRNLCISFLKPLARLALTPLPLMDTCGN